MFTGLIRSIGRVRRIQGGGSKSLLTLSHNFKRIPRKGDSIAVNGVCLTVCAADAMNFSAECYYATLAKSNLKNLRSGDRVHMEPALRMGDALDGHFVQGHVNRTVKVLSLKRADGGAVLRMARPEPDDGALIPEGAVALNGVSLTVSALDAASFAVQLIGETLSDSLLGHLRAGDEVNLETDMLLRGRHTAGINENKTARDKNPSGLTKEKLMQWGYV